MPKQLFPNYVSEFFAEYPDEIVRPSMALADGSYLSVQGSSVHYCSPKTDGATNYDAVEVGSTVRLYGLGAAEKRYGKQAYWVYPFRSTAAVNAYIYRKGGLK